MDTLLELGKIILPAALVLYAMYLTMKSALAKEAFKANMDYKIENSKAVLPNRLQAFERMSLFLERLSPGNLVLRHHDSPGPLPWRKRCRESPAGDQCRPVTDV